MRIVGSYVPENDELLYSFLLRLAEDNFLGIDYFAENFIDDRPGRPLPYKLSIGNTIYMPKIAAYLGVDPLDFYLKTSLYPGTAPLQSAEKQSRIINFVFRENIHKYPLLSGRINQDITELKYCPVCRKEDINTHGHTWLRRAHHMTGVTVCWKHGVRLGTAVVDHKAKLGQLILPNMPVEEGAEEERQFAIFAKDFLESGPDLNVFLTTQMIRKQQKHMVWTRWQIVSPKFYILSHQSFFKIYLNKSEMLIRPNFSLRYSYSFKRFQIFLYLRTSTQKSGSIPVHRSMICCPIIQARL